MVQMAASTEDLPSNQDKILLYIRKSIQAGVQLICFPEMALIGYGFLDIQRRLTHQTAMLEEIQSLAIEGHITVMIGGIEEISHGYYISQFVVNNDIETYRKIHIGAREGNFVIPGDEIKVFQVGGINIGLMLCYDGHFPELATVMKGQGAHIILNPSASPNLPDKRIKMWEKYLIARAYDNRVWVGAANLRFKGKGGGTLVIDSNGNTVAAVTADEDHMTIVDYVPDSYSTTTMNYRDFSAHRRADVYEKYR